MPAAAKAKAASKEKSRASAGDLGATLKLEEGEQEETEEDAAWAAEWAALTELRKARSEPNLPCIKLPAPDREYLRDHRPAERYSVPGDSAPYRKGLKELYHLLDEQVAYRKDAKDKEREARRGKARVLAQRQRLIKDGFLNQKPPFNYNDGPGYFGRATYIDEEQDKTNDARLLRMFRDGSSLEGVPASPSKQKAAEKASAVAGHPKKASWVPHSTNERHEQLAEFGTKARKRMYSAERMYADRLKTRLQEAQDADAQDALFRTTGSMRKKHLEENAPPYSVLSPNKRMWRDQMVSTMAYFSNPEPYRPGEQGYDTGLMEYVMQPWRAMDFTLDVVAGDANRTQHWHQPEEAIRGTTRRLQEAQDLSRSCWNRTRPPEDLQATGKRLEGDDADSLLQQFAAAMMYKYPNAAKAFKIFDINGNGQLSLSEFSQYAKTFFTGDATSVYKALDVHKLGYLEIRDFDVLQQLEDAARQKAYQLRETRRLELQEKRLMAKQASVKMEKQMRMESGRTPA